MDHFIHIHLFARKTDVEMFVAWLHQVYFDPCLRRILDAWWSWCMEFGFQNSNSIIRLNLLLTTCKIQSPQPNIIKKKKVAFPFENRSNLRWQNFWWQPSNNRIWFQWPKWIIPDLLCNSLFSAYSSRFLMCKHVFYY